MINPPAIELTVPPNDFSKDATRAGFYTSNTDFPSYFGTFQRLSGIFTTGSKVFFLPRKTAIAGRSDLLAPCMAIL